jgi:uncharacterized protein (TIGR00255 family)
VIRSMTGYGRGESSLGEKKFVAEIKSVNNRYRDIILKLPRAFQVIEDELRSQIASRMRRGRIEVVVQFEKSNGPSEYALELNLPVARSYFRIMRELCEEFGLDPNIRADDLCQMKDVILFKSEDVNMDEMRVALQEVIGLALDSCDGMRFDEGQAIKEDLSGRLDRIEQYLGEIAESAPLVVEEYRKRLKERVHQILQGMEADETRLAQEIALFADRSDITEEIVRAKSHLGQFRKYMTLEDAVGRRLDFLTQEIHREINTLSAKASSASISAKAVEIKAELEKLREQVQNVE